MRTTIEKYPSTVDVIAGVAGEKDSDPLEVVGLAPSSGGDAVDYSRVCLFVVDEPLGKGGMNPALKKGAYVSTLCEGMSSSGRGCRRGEI